MCRHVFDGLRLHDDVTTTRGTHACNRFHGGTFARTIATEQSQSLAHLKVQIEPKQHLAGVIQHLKLVDTQYVTHGHAPRLCPNKLR